MSNHAKERASHRGIEQADIQRIVDNPIETIYEKYSETSKSYGKAIDPYSKADVYHNGFNKYVRIITVMCVNSVGGLKAHGFSNI